MNRTIFLRELRGGLLQELVAGVLARPPVLGQIVAFDLLGSAAPELIPTPIRPAFLARFQCQDERTAIWRPEKEETWKILRDGHIRPLWPPQDSELPQ